MNLWDKHMTTGRINQVLSEGAATRRKTTPTMIKNVWTTTKVLSPAFASDSIAMSSHCKLPNFGTHQLRLRSRNHIWLLLQFGTKLHRSTRCNTTVRFLTSPWVLMHLSAPKKHLFELLSDMTIIVISSGRLDRRHSGRRLPASPSRVETNAIHTSVRPSPISASVFTWCFTNRPWIRMFCSSSITRFHLLK